MKEKSIKKNVILSTIYQILTMIIPLITAPYIARVIGPNGVGIYSYTLSIETYFSLFAALGTVAYGTREIARVRNDEKKRSILFWEIELLTILTSLISLVVWIAFIGFSAKYKIYYIILTLNIFNVLFDISWFFAGLEEFKYTIFQNSLFKILGVVCLFVFVKSSDDLALYIFIMSLSTLLGTASMWFYLPKFLIKINLKELRILRHFRETLIYFIPAVATSIYTVLDKTLIGIITKDNFENGYYEQATKIMNMLKALTFASLNTVLGSRISYLFSTGKIEEIHNRIDNSIDFICFMGFGIMFGLISVSNIFVPIFFGQGYNKVISMLQLMSPLIVIIGLSNCLGSQYYNPAGLRSKSAIYIIIGSFTNLILNIILIPKYKSYGAIVATIIAESLISFLYLKNSSGFMNFKKIINFSYKKIAAGIIMMLFIFILSLLKINDLILLIIEVILGGLVYIMILIIMKDKFTYKIVDSILSKIHLGKKLNFNE